MASVFDKMASLEGFSKADVADFFSRAGALTTGEVGAVLGYLLGRLDSQDAAAVVAALRERQPQRVFHFNGRATLNIVGTGGGPSTFNVTTTAAFVIAAAGVVVVKTGSAASRSKSGFADVAARLGTLKVTMPWEELESIARDVGIVFVPPVHHARELARLEHHLTSPAYRSAGAYFNKLGPLLSPVKVDYRFVGAHSMSCLEMLAGACSILGDAPTSLVSSMDGMDEVSTRARTVLVRLMDTGRRSEQWIDPRSLDIEPPAPEAIAGMDPAASAECCERILSGKGSREQADIVALNAGVVLAQMGQCVDWAAGYQRALEILRNGMALAKLNQLRERVWKCVKR
jgi:anthranilate phosphoribosyltransferase